MKKNLVIVFAIAVLLITSMSFAFTTGLRVITYDKAIGTATPEILNEIMSIFRSGDETLMKQTIQALEAEGKIRTLEKGLKVYVIQEVDTLLQIKTLDDGKVWWTFPVNIEEGSST